MEQLSNKIIPFENGNIVGEDEAYDQYFISSMNSKYKSPEVDNFDVAGNKEPTLGETIAEGVKTVGTAINDQDTTLAKIGEDTIKGMLKGSDKGGSNALTGIAQTVGAVVDGVNEYIVEPGLNTLGFKASDRPFMGTEMNVDAVNKISGVINDLIPNFLKNPINEFANEPLNYETYGTIIEEVSKLGITAVPAAKIVGMMSSANAIVRGFAWGGIADYMSINPEDPAIATFLVDYFETDREKLEPWARNAISVLEKHDTDGVITKRLKNMMEGTIAGGIAEGILPLVKGIISATSIVPWAKTVTPLVGGAGVTYSDDAEGSVFTPLVKAAAKEVLPNTVAKNADNVMQVDNLSDGRISTRLPTAVNSIENAVTEDLNIGLNEIKSNPDIFNHNINVTKDYPNLKLDEIKGNPEEVSETYINHMKDNLIWLHDKVPEKTRLRSKLWYDGANKVSNDWSKEFNIPPNSVAGVLAALSPQKDWFMNASLGYRVLDIMSKKQDIVFDNKMLNVANRIFKQPQYKEMLNYIKNKKLSELETSTEKAMWLRIYDQTNSSPSYKTLTPEGEFTDFVKTDKGVDSKIAWNSLGMIAKAIDSFESGGDLKVLTPLMGNKHKVRSFYNNIISPKSNKGDVTIDTHAVAASTLRPVSGNSTIVHHNFGTAPEIKKRLPDWNGAVKNSAVNGVQGLYGLYAEAYRRAALERGILPREMQSITWEAIRGLFPAGFKQSRQNVEEIDKLWYKYRDGNLTLDEVRNGIEQRANGIDAPSWE